MQTYCKLPILQIPTITGSCLEQAITLKWYGQVHTKLVVDMLLTEKEILSKNLLSATMEMLEIC